MNLTDEPLATVDMGDFESNIDRAIDELFVHKSGVAAPSPEQGAPAVGAPGKVQPSPPKVATDLLQGLKESLLSLDWEISADNIQKFERELDALKDKLGEDRHSLAVIKMALGVCKYLRAMKYSASAVSVQFLHSATRTLDLLQRKPQLGAAERRDLMDKMLTKFRRLKAEVQRMKTVKAGEPKAAPAEFTTELAVEEPAPVAEQPEELVLEPLPEAEEAAPEPEPLLVAEKEEPLLQGPEEELALPAEQEEEPILPLAPEKPTSRYREDTLEIEPEDEERGVTEAKDEEQQPVARLEEVPSEPAPEAAAGWRDRLDEARSQSSELIQCLTDLGQESDKFFGRLLQAVAGKAALQRVAEYFGKIHLDQAEKLAQAQQSAFRLGETLEALGHQTPRAGEGAEPLPEGHGVVSAQLRQIQESLRRLSESVSRLEEGSSPPPAVAGGDELTHEILEPVTLDAPLEPVEELEPSEILALPEIPEPSEVADSEAPDDLPLMDEALEPEQPSRSSAAAEVSTAAPALTQIFLTNVAGTTIGIPIEAVSHVFKVSKGKAKALRKRGYATLVDFKAPFRSIKRGLSGPLAEQPVTELKKARFPLINLSPEVVGTDGAKVAQAPVKGIVILSDGQRHGSLLSEDLLEKRPYQILGFRPAGLPGDVMGTATIEGDFEINVLNLDRLLT